MGNNNRATNFLDLYFESMDDNIETVISELREAGIDPEQSEINIKQLIKQNKAEIKLEKGRILKEKVLNKIKEAADVILTSDMESRLVVQFRKLGKLAEEDKKEIKKNEALLSEIEKLIDE